MILRISYFLIFYDKNNLGEEGFIVANGFRDMVLCSTWETERVRACYVLIQEA